MTGSHERRLENNIRYIPEVLYDAVAPVLTDVRIDPRGAQSLLDTLDVSNGKGVSFVVSGEVRIEYNWRHDTKTFIVPWATISPQEYFTVLKNIQECGDISRVVGGECDPDKKIYLYPDALLFVLIRQHTLARELPRWGKRMGFDELLDLIQQEAKSANVRALVHECEHAVQPREPATFSLKDILLRSSVRRKREDKANDSAADPVNIARAQQAVEVSFPLDRNRMLELIIMTCEYHRQSFRK